MKSRLPRGVLGALFGSLGSLPLLPIASRLATELSSPSSLPGMERRLHDVKAATYAEAGVLLLLLPLCGILFGDLLPRSLEARAAAGRLSFEWAGAGFCASFFLAQRGLAPERALLAGLVLATLFAIGIFAFRESFRVRRLFSRRGRRAALLLVLCGASLDLARRAARGGSRGPLPDLVSDLAIAGLSLLVLAVFVCVRFSRRPDVAFHRAGRATWMPILLAAVAIAIPPTSPTLLWLAFGSLAAGAILLPKTGAGARTASRLAILALLVVCGWRILRIPVTRLDLFEDGCSLSPAQNYLRGARPYVDVVPVHGWGTDGGLDAFCFRTFGSTLKVFELRRSIWAVIAFALLGVLSVVALDSGFWGTIAFLFALDLCHVTFERQTLAFAALLCLFWGLRRRSAGALLAAGAIGGVEIMHSLDYGLLVVVGGAAGLLLLPALSSRTRDGSRPPSAKDGTWFLAGSLLGALPFLALLARQGALGEFLRASFLETPRWVAEVWNYPAGSAWKSLLSANRIDGVVKALTGEAGMPSLFLLLVLAAVAIVLLLRALGGRFDVSDRSAWVAFTVAMVAMRMVLGRADVWHLGRYGLFVGLPAAWLLMRLWQSVPACRVLCVVTTLLILTRLHPLKALDDSLGQVEAAARRDSDAIGAQAPRSGGALLPADQAADLVAFRRYLDARLGEGETFFDFTNQPGLYFVADRAAPIRYITVSQYETEEAQREVLADLERGKPPIAILPSGRWGDLDRVSNEQRAPRVARYVADHYAKDEVVGAWVLARRVRALSAGAKTPRD